MSKRANLGSIEQTRTGGQNRFSVSSPFTWTMMSAVGQTPIHRDPGDAPRPHDNAEKAVPF